MLTGKKDQVIELRQKRLCSTCQDIATRVGISRERVRQILKRAGLPTLRYRAPYLCADCGKPLNRINNKSGLCLECRIKSNRVPLICDTCGKLFYRKKAEIMSQSQPHTGFFCSKSCWGTKMGNTYGFVVNPQNCRRIRKYDYDAIWQKYTLGFTGYRISKMLNVPESGIYYILRILKKEKDKHESVRLP